MTSEEQGPWWASGADDIVDEADPLAAHRAARKGASEDEPASGSREYDVPWEDWDRRDAPPPSGSQRSAFEDAMEGLQALGRAVAARRGDADRKARVHDETCRSCVWCMTVRSLGDARPEVTEHLDQAMRHMVAAARSWVDAAEERGGSWEKIELDDEDGA